MIDTEIQQLIINKLTKAQYEAALEAGTISPNEFYAVTDEEDYVTVSTFNNTMANYTDTANLANVALSGSYNDLTDKPVIPSGQVQTDWNATEGMAVILNKPTLAAVATNGSYNDLSDTPTVDQAYNGLSANAQSGVAIASLIANYTDTANLANVALSGSYNDLSDTPTIPDAQVQSDWNATTGMGVILNKPTLANVATSGEYGDLLNTPTVDQTYNGSSVNAQSGTAVAGLIANYMTSTEVTNAISNAIASVYRYKGSVDTYANLPSSGQEVGDVYNVEEDGANYAWTGSAWDKLSENLSNYVTIDGTATLTNKTINLADNTIIGLASVATSGSYNDLSDTPTIPDAQVQSDWNATTGMGVILNKPTLAAVALSGEYGDLLNTPTVDQTYNGSSVNAQSGTAVANAIANMQVTTNMVDSITNLSTNTTYPTASAVYNAIEHLSGVVFREWE